MKLAEFAVTVGIVSIMTATSAGIAIHTRNYRSQAAILHVFGLLSRARTTAMTGARYAGVFIEADPKTGETVFWRVVDGNGNGLRKKEIAAGIDRKVERGFVLERDYKGVLIKKNTFRSGILSFSPNFKSSTGSLVLGTDDPGAPEVRIKLYGLTTIVRPVKIWPDGREEPL